MNLLFNMIDELMALEKCMHTDIEKISRSTIGNNDAITVFKNSLKQLELILYRNLKKAKDHCDKEIVSLSDDR